MENCDMSGGKLLAWKLSVISFTIIVLGLWSAARNWVFGISIWWWVAVFVIAVLKSGCCGSSVKGSAGSGAKKTVRRKRRKKK